MKLIYQINKVVLIITYLLYLTIFFGLYAQMALGAIQIIYALLLFFYWKKLSNKTKNQLYIYWAIVIVYGLCWLLDWKDFNDTFYLIFGMMVVPMAIATYFVYLLKVSKNEMS